MINFDPIPESLTGEAAIVHTNQQLFAIVTELKRLAGETGAFKLLAAPNLSGNKITNVAKATDDTDVPQFSQVSLQSAKNLKVIQQQLQVLGLVPLNVTGLPGLPVVLLEGTHAQRPDPGTITGNTFYLETDRTALFALINAQGVQPFWRYVAGVMYSLLASRPTDLGPGDAGFEFYATDRAITYRWTGTAWTFKTELGVVFEGKHLARVAAGTVNTNNLLVTWASGTKFDASWVDLAIVINGVAYNVASVTDDQHLVLSTTAGIQAGVAYLGGYFSYQFATGAGFYETDRTVSYVTAVASGTLNTVGTAVAWVSGDKFNKNWVGASIAINGVSYVIAAVASNVALTLALTAGNQAGVGYSVAGGKWLYLSGIYIDAFALRPADLGVNDFGFLFYATDRHILYYWDGAAWQIVFTPVFEGSHATRLTATYYPWRYATGTQFWELDRTAMYLTADSTGTVTTVGTAVAWVSGDKFDVNWGAAPQPTITINGVSYPIASVASNIALTLATTAGNQVGVAYTLPSGKWIYEAGTCNTTQATIPNDLAVNDFGFLENVTDYSHVLQWDGAAWRFGPGDAGGGFIQGFAQAPANTNGWVACTGQGAGAVKYLKSDGTLGNAPALPAAVGGYAKFAAAYNAARGATQTDDEAISILLTTASIPTGDGTTGFANVVVGAVNNPDPHHHLLANPEAAGADVDLAGVDLIPYFRV